MLGNNLETILLHKKNDETLLENHQPIALANTMYKLWTGLIQECLNMYAVHYSILSNSQEGFRRYRNTMMWMTSTIPDAWKQSGNHPVAQEK
jgi:hypothetical protein